MKVTVFGAGYVGLVQAAVLAEVGHHVHCVDVDEDRVEGLRNGIVPIYEPGLDSLIVEGVKNQRLGFSTNAKMAIEKSDVIFIAVGTPPDEDGSADLQYVLKVAETIGEYSNSQKIVVTKSTVPVGTADKVKIALHDGALSNKNELPKDPFSVVSNPEFLKEGSAISDCKKPDRIIIGTDEPVAIEAMKELYAPFNRNHDRIIVMDTRSSELTKYAANSMLATKISFMNEISSIAEKCGADIENVRKGIGSDPRIGYQFIYPGCGYGGSCFPKDVQALVRTSEEIGVKPRILTAVESVNGAQKVKLMNAVLDYYSITHEVGELKGKIFAVWGLSFKPNTDDMREAPSRVFIDEAIKRGAKVKVYDPEAMDEAKRIWGNNESITYSESQDDCIEGADALIVCTEWQQFRSPDLKWLCQNLKDRLIVDGRNIYSPEAVEAASIAYYGIGRGRSVTSIL